MSNGMQRKANSFQLCKPSRSAKRMVAGNDSKDDPLYTTLQLAWQIRFFPGMILHVLKNTF